MCTTAQEGHEVEIFYTGKLKNETVFDSNLGKEPFKFVVGSQNVIKGVSNAVIGMESGQKKTIEIAPEDAYGSYNEKLVGKVPRKSIPESAASGDFLTDSKGFSWWIRELDNEFAIIDGNHPLSGQPLIFEIELIRINH